MSIWFLGRIPGGRRRAYSLSVHVTALLFFLLVTMMAVFVFVSRLF